MLAPRYLAGISDDIVELYAQLEADILADMARRIKKIGAITDASKFQAGILEQCGGLKQDISKILSKYDKSTIQQVSSIFTDALQKSVEADNRIFQEATGRTVTENQAQAMIAAIQKTHSDLQSLTMTTAVTSQQDFIKQANAAYMEVSTGAFDYDTAMKHAADNLAEHGVTTVQYENGKAVTRTIESAVRMNILTGVNQTAAAVTMDNCDELNCNLVEVSAHEGARPEHAAWQGKVYSLNGRVMNDDGTVKYESFDVCGYGEVDGICGINCRHSFYPYFEGYSQQHYAQKDIEEMSKKDYEYNGQKMTRYEAEQTLRKTERTIRAYKRRITTEEAVGADTKSAQLKLGEWQARARDFTNQTGIKRDYAREYIGTAGVQPKALQSSKIVATKSVIKSATQQQAQTIAIPAHDEPVQQAMNGTYKVFKNATGSMDQFVQKAIDTQTMTPVQSYGTVEGQNIVGKVHVKPSTSDILDAIKLQRFDSKPTVLSRDDFIQAVNDDTFIAQRTYTAPDKETLDKYIDMLRNGEFYVDCRVGGKAHGKGMYAAADYTKGKNLKKIVAEMENYQNIGNIMRGEPYTMTETLTLKAGAKIIDEKDVVNEFIYKYSKELASQGLPSNKILDRIIAQHIYSRDIGVMAAEMGYDAIRSQGVTRSDYMVILNRSKLILLGGK